MKIRLKSVILFLFSLSLVVSVACKKNASPTSPTSPIENITLSGTIYSESQTFEDVDVYLSWGASQKKKTGADGKFRFSNLPSGSYVITPSKEGYAFIPPNYEVTETRTDLNFQSQIATFGARVGKIATDFTAKDQNGKNVSLYDFFGKVILFNLSADWCGPCRDEATHLESIYNQYKNRGFQIITILIDGDPAEWAQEYNLTFPVLDDSDQSIWSIYGEGGIPDNTIVDRNCTIRYKKGGYNQFEILETIEKYL